MNWMDEYIDYIEKTWEHWCHCHEMYICLGHNEKCDTCGRTQEDRDK